ncbi:phosphotransferase, partial [Pseudomonas aeruginosa]
MSDDARFQQLNRWLDSCLPELFVAEGWGEVPPAELIPASSDASFRRYFRWQGGDRSLVVMDAPPPQEDCRPFVKVAGLLAGAGVHVPRILAQDLENGFLLLSDLGRQTYLDVLHPGNADELFEPALDALIAFQKVDVAGVLPAYDEAVLRRELQLFPDWYLARHLGVELEGETLARW